MKTDLWPKLKLLPIYPLYLTTFALAAGSKWVSGGVPEWFRKQFGETFLNAFPGALGANYYFVATVETTVTLLFLVSLCRGEFLPKRPRVFLRYGLWLSQLAFTMLGFGLRVTGDFNGAANLFFYFGVSTLLLLYITE